jgi:hypothetical protein
MGTIHNVPLIESTQHPNRAEITDRQHVGGVENFLHWGVSMPQRNVRGKINSSLDRGLVTNSTVGGCAAAIEIVPSRNSCSRERLLELPTSPGRD